MSKRKIIIGAGISGLIFKYYNPDYTLISPEIGGQFNQKLSPPLFIHNLPETQSFLKDLGVSFQIKKFKICYFYNSLIHDEINDDFRKLFIIKKLSHSLFKLEQIQKITNLRLASETNELSFLECNYNLLLNKLTKQIEIIKKKVLLISIKKRYITLSDGYDKYYFDSLISTIPAPDFVYLCFDYAFKNKFKYLPSTLISCDNIPKWIPLDNWDQLYYVDNDQVYNRITKSKLYKCFNNINGKYILEIAGDLSKYECEKFLSFKINDYMIQRVSTIFNEEIKNPNYVNFLGRLATWQSNHRIQDAIKFSKEFKSE